MDEDEVENILEELKRKKKLFEDPDFPANASSLFYSKRSDKELKQFSWKRPYELAKDPSIYVDGTSRKDVIQGDDSTTSRTWVYVLIMHFRYPW